MVYMEVHCHNCGVSWKIGVADDYHRDGARTCPKCGKSIDRQTWEQQVLPALGAVQDANFELARDATGYEGQGAFSINVFSGDNPPAINGKKRTYEKHRQAAINGLARSDSIA